MDIYLQTFNKFFKNIDSHFLSPVESALYDTILEEPSNFPSVIRLPENIPKNLAKTDGSILPPNVADEEASVVSVPSSVFESSGLDTRAATSNISATLPAIL